MTPKEFPLQAQKGVPPGPVSIPWELAEHAYGAYVALYGNSQSLQNIADRQGFSWGEMDKFYPKWREEVALWRNLRLEIQTLKEELKLYKIKSLATQIVALHGLHSKLSECMQMLCPACQKLEKLGAPVNSEGDGYRSNESSIEDAITVARNIIETKGEAVE